VLQCDDDGDGRADRAVTVPMPIFHALGLLADMGDRFWVLPAESVRGHTVGGFASRDDAGDVRVLLYAHDARDTQSRSEAEFDLTLDLSGLGVSGPAQVRVSEYRFDADHNSPFRRARVLRDRPLGAAQAGAARLAAATRGLESGDPNAQRAALREVAKLDPATRQAAIGSILRLADHAKDPEVREAALATIRTALGPVAYPRAAIDEIQKLTELHATASTSRRVEPGGRLRLTARLAGNGCSFLVIGRDEGRIKDDAPGP
jgi:hypothetical protein